MWPTIVDNRRGDNTNLLKACQTDRHWPQLIIIHILLLIIIVLIIIIEL